MLNKAFVCLNVNRNIYFENTLLKSDRNEQRKTGIKSLEL